MADVILYEKNDRIVTITLNKPETRNALSKDLCEALVNAINRADADAGVSCVVLAASGKSFSSGGNLHEIKAMTAEQNMTPLIAAVNGHAIGAGNDLTTMCDIRIAGEDAIFAESFLRVGIIPGDGGAWLLPRIIGQARANQMLFTGEFIDAQKALDYGLVSEVVANDKLLERAYELAEMVVALPPLAIRKTKELVRTAQSVTLKENLDQAALFQGVLQQLDDHREAIDAILEKRKPVFKGA